MITPWSSGASIGSASRAALRVLAHGVDLAEASADPEQIATIGRVYVDALERHRLTPTEVREGDAFEKLLAELGRPTAGASNTADAYRATFGPAVAKLAAYMGRPLMPWQRLRGRRGARGRRGRPVLLQARDRHRAPPVGQDDPVSVPSWIAPGVDVPRARVWFTQQSAKDAVDWLMNEHWPLLSAARLRGQACAVWPARSMSGGTARPG